MIPNEHYFRHLRLYEEALLAWKTRRQAALAEGVRFTEPSPPKPQIRFRFEE